MKVRIGQLYQGVRTLNKLVDLELPIGHTFRLTKIVSRAREDFNAIEKIRDRLVRQHGVAVTNEDGVETGYQVPDDKRAAFFNDFVEVLNEEVEIDWTPISVDSLPNVRLSINELAAVSFLFVETEELRKQAQAQAEAQSKSKNEEVLDSSTKSKTPKKLGKKPIKV